MNTMNMRRLNFTHREVDILSALLLVSSSVFAMVPQYAYSSPFMSPHCAPSSSSIPSLHESMVKGHHFPDLQDTWMPDFNLALSYHPVVSVLESITGYNTTIDEAGIMTAKGITSLKMAKPFVSGVSCCERNAFWGTNHIWSTSLGF